MAKKNYIYQEILERLFTCQYRFGDRILVKEIGEEMGVSRHPIMTALYRLQERGFVTITAQVGCEVVTPTPEAIQDFYRMFALTEGLIAELAASRASAADISRLRLINDQIHALDATRSANADEYRRLNVDFHTQLHAMAKSPLLCSRQLANFELSDFFIVQTCGFRAHLGLVADEHNAVIAAIVARQPEAANRAAREHIESVSRSVAAALDKATEGDEASADTAP